MTLRALLLALCCASSLAAQGILGVTKGGGVGRGSGGGGNNCPTTCPEPTQGMTGTTVMFIDSLAEYSSINDINNCAGTAGPPCLGNPTGAGRGWVSLLSSPGVGTGWKAVRASVPAFSDQEALNLTFPDGVYSGTFQAWRLTGYACAINNVYTASCPYSDGRQVVYTSVYFRLSSGAQWNWVKGMGYYENCDGATRGEAGWAPSIVGDSGFVMSDNYAPACNGGGGQNGQPLGSPLAAGKLSSSADGNWHRWTFAVLPNTTTGTGGSLYVGGTASSRDGFWRVWIDGTLILDYEANAVGVTPSGGSHAWATNGEVDQIGGNGVPFVQLLWPSVFLGNNTSFTWDFSKIWVAVSNAACPGGSSSTC